MELIVPFYVLVIDIILFLAIGYVLAFMVKRLGKYRSEIDTLVRYSVIFLGIAELGRVADLIDDFCCMKPAEYFELFAYSISIVGVIYAIVHYIKLMESSYIPRPPSLYNKSSFGAHVVFSKTRFLDVMELLKGADFPVLAVTRSPNMYKGFENVSTVWVTQVSEGINPTALHVLQDVIIRFVRDNPSSVVLIDCVEYLLLYNDFKAVFKFLTNLKDYVVFQLGSGLVIFVDDSILNEQEKALFLKEFEPL